MALRILNEVLLFSSLLPLAIGIVLAAATMLSQLPAKRLTVIKAPTGFGKTSLAASWSEWPRFY
jgi:LuxR family transcriptional regulator, maltose regulon positive regulatory protein